MLILEAGTVCPHKNCPYDQPEGSCFGTRRNRQSTFTCEYANEAKIFSDGVVRNPLDQTGKMRPIMEQN